MGQRPQLFDRRPDVILELGHERPRPFGVALGKLLEQPHLDGERNQVLLRPVVQVAFDPSPLGVGGRHQTPARCLQLDGLAAQSLERILQRRVQTGLVQRHA